MRPSLQMIRRKLARLLPAAPAVAEAPAVAAPTEITTTQWLSVISIIVSLAGLYYKREEIKGLLTPKAKTPPALPQAPPPSPVVPKRGKITEMDLNVYLFYCYNNGV